MEQNEMIAVPFDIRLANAIQAGIVKGRIRTKGGNYAGSVICLNKIKRTNGSSIIVKLIVSLIYDENSHEEEVFVHNVKGEVDDKFSLDHDYDLVIDVKRSELPFIEKFIYSA